jgi:hypothetical protein|tara:strand:- start:674 stop:1216 length:543 start_codon:yes stop_codon:yes gene_type:complete
MAKAIRSYSNAEQVKELSLLKRIKVEQTFAQQVYANFQSIRFGIEACCYTDVEQAILRKDICDWQNAASTKIVVATEVPGVFVEPLAKINSESSISCPSIPTNVCTVLDLESIIGATGTFTECFTDDSKLWTITHNLGKFPSVTIVDDNKEVVIGAIDYKSTNQVTVSFNSPLDGCAFLN